MSAPKVRLPVVCPVCKAEQLTDFDMAEVTTALLYARPLRLSATCHNQSWTAASIEIHQIRKHLQSQVRARLESNAKLSDVIE